jgi:uncharacterized protein
MLDVHARLRRHWRLPVSSYGLKAVAAWLGFAWFQKVRRGFADVL